MSESVGGGHASAHLESELCVRKKSFEQGNGGVFHWPILGVAPYGHDIHLILHKTAGEEGHGFHIIFDEDVVVQLGFDEAIVGDELHTTDDACAWITEKWRPKGVV